MSARLSPVLLVQAMLLGELVPEIALVITPVEPAFKGSWCMRVCVKNMRVFLIEALLGGKKVFWKDVLHVCRHVVLHKDINDPRSYLTQPHRHAGTGFLVRVCYCLLNV